jgi:hypothetical protein
MSDPKPPSEILACAIAEAGVTGQWSHALDLIRTDLIEPLQARIRELENPAPGSGDGVQPWETEAA